MSTRRRQPRRSSDTSPRSPSVEGDGWIAIGMIVGTLGLRGELKVDPLTDFPERFGSTPVVYLGTDHTPYHVVGASLRKHQIVLRLEGVADATTAERLRNYTIWIPEAQLHPLEHDRYYFHDLIGLEVRHRNGQLLGTVADVMTGAANDVLVVRDPAGARDTLLPFVKAFVKQVDLERRVMSVDPIPGLFDDQYDEAR